MEITVTCRSAERREFIQNCAEFYAKQLRLVDSRYNLRIRTVWNLGRDQGCRGEVVQIGYREIYMVLDSRLSMYRLMLTLAHEMVHVKQIAKGQYKGRRARNGRILACWRGVPVRAEYLKRPWEMEAFRRQGLLVQELVEYVARRLGRI